MAIRKRKKAKTQRRAKGGPAEAPQMDADNVITLPEEPEDEDDGETITINPLTGAVSIENEDGSITVDPTGASLWQQDDDADTGHDANLALKIDGIELGRISEELLDAIQSDKQDRSQWEQMRAKCIELLGMKLEDPKGDVSRSALGMSTSVVRDPTLLQAVEFFRANAYGELCPAGGPVKVVNFAPEESIADNSLADDLQSDMNYYLTTTASEYYPDMYRMLWWTGLASGTFKKIYNCPRRQRPVSEFVDGTKLIVPSNTTDLKNADRITHEVEMSRDLMRWMQVNGVYRDTSLTDPMPPMINAVEAKAASTEGVNPLPQRIEDQKYTIYECYCRLNIRGFEHKKNGKPTGVPVPYRVTIDETSREILEIRRNWDEDEADSPYLDAKIPFVLFPFSTGLSAIYGSGLGQMMGNIASALTALLRISIDGGILGNYPGFVKAKGTGRDVVNEIMIPPGGAVEIDTGGLPIQQVLMPAPYKDASPATMSLMQQTRDAAKGFSGNMAPVAEGKQDAPVGTTLAMIEQATKPLSATHKMLHAAQSEEFRLIAALLKEDPEALWRGNPRPAMGKDVTARLAKFKAALDNCDIQPMADPNVPSEMHRKLLALALKQLTAGNPAYNQVEIDRYIAKSVLKMPDADFNKFLAAPQAAQPDPAVVAALQLEAQKVQIAQQKVQVDAFKAKTSAENAQAQIASKEQIEAMKMAASQQPQGDGGASQQLAEAVKMSDQAIKNRQLDLQTAKMVTDAREKQLDRDSKEAIEAFKLVQAQVIHPEAAALADQELGQLSAYIEPAAKSAADGGRIESDDPLDGLVDDVATIHLRAQRYGHRPIDTLDLATRIAQALNRPMPTERVQ